jgi:uncharacterized protein with HEPN domain
MPPDRDSATVLDIVLAAQRIGDFTAGQDFEGFAADLKTQSAVILQLLVIGEAAKRLSAAFREQHPEAPWSDIMRMRDKLIHHYEDVDLELVWRVIRKEVPELRALLEPLLSNSEP